MFTNNSMSLPQGTLSLIRHSTEKVDEGQHVGKRNRWIKVKIAEAKIMGCT